MRRIMSARRHRLLLPGLLLGVCSVVLAADDELPEMDFIEYLGMWEESDEVWLVLDDGDERLASESDEGTDPLPQGRESTGTDDES